MPLMRPCNRGWIARRQRKRRSLVPINQPQGRPVCRRLRAEAATTPIILDKSPCADVNSMSMPRTKSPKSPRRAEKREAVRVARKSARKTITGREIVEALAPQGRLLERMLCPGADGKSWLVVVGKATRAEDAVIDYASFRRAYQRLMMGERPPPLPRQRGATPAILGKHGRPTEAGSALLKAWRFLQDADKIVLNGRKSTFTVHWEDGSFRMFKVVGQAGESRLVDITYSAAGLRFLDSLPTVDGCGDRD
jgi:hypothetical protein